MENQSFKRVTTIAMRLGMKKESLEALFDGLETLMHACIIGFGAMYINTLIETGEMENKDTLAFMLVGFQMINSFQEVLRGAPRVANTFGPASILMALTHRVPRMNLNVGKKLTDLDGSISFKNVDFTYPFTNIRSFTDFNLEVPSGSSCAFVGPSGCGKSTLFKMMLRFYDPENGAVMIDNKHDLKSLNATWWLENVGVVSQEPVLFKDTLEYSK